MAEVRWRIAVSVALGFLVTVFGIGRRAAIGWALGLMVTGRATETLIAPLAIVAVATILKPWLEYYLKDFNIITGHIVQRKLHQQLFEQLMRVGPGYLASQRTGEILLSLNHGVYQLRTYTSDYVPQVLTAVLAPIAIYAFVAFMDWQTAVIYAVAAVLAVVAPTALFPWTSRASERRRDALAKFGSDFLDSIQGLPTLQAFGQTNSRAAFLRRRAHELFRSTMLLLATNAGSTVATNLFVVVGTTLALAWGAIRVADGTLEVTTLFVVLMLGAEVFDPAHKLAKLYHQGMTGLAALASVLGFMDAVPLVREPEEPKTPAPNTPPSVEFSDVTFTYPATSAPALRGISFRADAGETIGIVGPSGAGKSTLLWLLERFYDPDSGIVRVNGMDIRSLALDELQSQVAVVSQDPYLFNGTVTENIALGCIGASDADIRAAARAANAEEFIDGLPHGYETRIGERGIRLSGGQRQRIAIARAMLKDAPIVVLDEALSAVDSVTESKVQDSLNRLSAGKLTIVIAHRLSSVLHADRTVVLEDGKVVEVGTHADLLLADGTYARLMADQAMEAKQSEERERDDLDTLLDSRDPDAEVRLGETGELIRSETVGRGETTRFLLGLARSARLMLASMGVLALASKASQVGLAVVAAVTVGQAVQGHSLDGYLIALAALAIGGIALQWLESWVSHTLAFGSLADMRVNMFLKLDELGPGYLQRRRTGDLVGTATHQIDNLEFFFGHYVPTVVVAALMPPVLLIVLAFVNPWLALVIVPFALLMTLPGILSLDRRRHYTIISELYAEADAHASDSVQGAREIAQLGQGKHFVRRASEKFGDAKDELESFMRKYERQNALTDAITGYGMVAVLILGTLLIDDGSLSRFMLPVAIVLSIFILSPVVDFSVLSSMAGGMFASASRVAAVQTAVPDVADGQGVVNHESRGLGTTSQLVVDDVSFAYDYSKGPALESVSFSVNAGATVALVGQSGAGKTTLAHLLMRFWDPESGQIALEGRNLRDYRLNELRDQITLVAQDTYLFNGTIRDNLLVAKPGAGDSELENALRLAGLSEFLMAGSDGLSKPVGERGIQISGGQRQRIAIARAFLKDAPIIILDEATSHLDAVNERLVHEALDRLKAGRTTIVIAHRLSTVRNADLIVVMHHGKLVESGTHSSLLAQRGLYASLVDAQLLATAGSA